MPVSKKKRVNREPSKQNVSSSIAKWSIWRVLGKIHPTLRAILIFIACTLIYFAPVVSNIRSYSVGGDAMFNAWEMRRNQNCILGNNCEDYRNANIYFPNEKTMLYSESQLSAGLVTLPFYWVDENPILAYNVLTVALFFFSAFFMYLLAKEVNGGNEAFAIFAGLIFAFAPFKIAAIYHLQNLSICCLPLSIFFILKYVKFPQKRYLSGLFFALLYVFFASWVQMIFVLMALGIVVLSLWLIQRVPTKLLLKIGGVIGLAGVMTVPLALEYIAFSKETKDASFGIEQQILYSADVKDYFLPYEDTFLGELYYDANPSTVRNAYNPDSFSYHGVILYLIGLFVVGNILFSLYKKRAPDKKVASIIGMAGVLGVVGFIVSLGPFLKFGGQYVFMRDALAEGVGGAVPLPWLIASKILPQLDFIRALGRASVLLLFALCLLFALFPALNTIRNLSKKKKLGLYVGIFLLVWFELLPIKPTREVTGSFAHNLSIPNVYRFIKESKDIDNIIILNADYDYPGASGSFARAEQVLWAGYHNKNIFNGYSGYTPTNYIRDFEDFVTFDKDDVKQLQDLNVNYILVDKGLMKSKPWVDSRVAENVNTQIYEDERYSLYRVAK